MAPAGSSAASFSLKNVTVQSLTAYLNQRYACEHGYAMLYLRLSEPGCEHPRWGHRHPSYCKLAAISEALSRGHRWAVFLDTDCYVHTRSLDMPALLRAYGGGAADDAYFGWDTPYTLGPNAGFSVVANTRGARALLRSWWHAYAGRYSTEHAFEQHVLHWQLVHLHRFRHNLTTLRLRTMDPRYPDAVHHPAFPSIELRPGGRYVQRTAYVFNGGEAHRDGEKVAEI